MQPDRERYEPLREYERKPYGDGPPADGFEIRKDDTDFVVRAAVPGVKEEDVQVSVEDGQVRIRAKRDEPANSVTAQGTPGRAWVRMFDYVATLPWAVDSDRITAQAGDGVVTVKAPLRDGTARAIEVRPMRL